MERGTLFSLLKKLSVLDKSRVSINQTETETETHTHTHFRIYIDLSRDDQ